MTTATYATPGPVPATVEVAGARVRVTAGARTDTVVRVEPVDATSRADVRVADRTRVEFADGRLSVKTTVSGAKDGSVVIAIDLPARSGLAVYAAYSSIEVDGPIGRCELHQASGRVRLDRVEELRANLASGEVAVGHVAGPADVDGAAFALRIGAADGPVRLSNSGGRARIGHAAAGLEFSTAGCDLDVGRTGGDVTATTAGGAIRIGRLTHGRTTLLTGSGNIEVGIDAGAAASVDAGSERGAVHDLVSTEPHPDPSDQEVLVHARTRHGDVIIRRAAE